MDVEAELFRSFVVRAKRKRYGELLETKRGRDKIRFSLDHFKDLDPLFSRKLGGADGSRASILQAFRSLGAHTTCHIISVDSDLDGREVELSEALAAVVGSGQGTFISCVPGVLAYFEGEGPYDQYICHRE